MEETDIITQTLQYLDNWVLDTDVTEQELTNMDYNKSVTREEIMHFYTTAVNYAVSYTQNNEITAGCNICEIAFCMWTAGLLWAKYNQNINNNLDETNANPFGYGDKLVIQAKQMLKPYTAYKLNTW